MLQRDIDLIEGEPVFHLDMAVNLWLDANRYFNGIWLEALEMSKTLTKKSVDLLRRYGDTKFSRVFKNPNISSVNMPTIFTKSLKRNSYAY